MDESTTLADLLELNLHECEEEVKNIVDKAVKEMSMEKYMKELNVTWSKMEFEREVHSRTGATLIRASEELIETLEENQVNYLINISTNSSKLKHFKYFQPIAANYNFLFKTAGTIAKSDHFEIYRALPGGGVIVAKEIEYRRSGNDNLVRSSTYLDASREHLHVV